MAAPTPEPASTHGLGRDLGVLLSFLPASILQVGAGDGAFLEEIAPRVGRVLASDRCESDPLAAVLARHGNIEYHRVDSFLKPPPCRADLLVTDRLLETLPVECLEDFLGDLEAMAPGAFHRIGCFADGPRVTDPLPPEVWLDLLKSVNPDFERVRVEYLGEDPDFPVAVFIKGHPAFKGTDLHGILRGTETLVGLELLEVAEAFLRRDRPDLTSEDELGIGVALGNVLLERGLDAQSQAHFQRLVERHPAAPIAYVNLCGSFLRGGNRELAIIWAKLAQNLFPGEPDFATLRTLLESGSAGTPEDALPPEETPAPGEVAPTLEQVEALLEEGQAGEAEALLRKAISSASDDDATLLQVALGNVILQSGREGEALEHFQRLAKTRPHEAMVYVNLCGAFIQCGKPDIARAWLTLARELFPGNPDLEQVTAYLDPPAEEAVAPPVRIGILSGFFPGLRFNSQVNQKAYADAHGYDYIFNGSPEWDPRHYFRKIETLVRYLHLFDWIFWIDDDAYFTDFSTPLETFLAEAQDHDLVICRSPSTKKLFTKISSGQFFLRNSPRAHAFLQALLDTDLEAVKAFWREDHGYFSCGDQDAMVYLSETDPRFREGFFRILDHNRFNNREFEYQERLEEHFLVHFTGQTKVATKAQFCERLGVNRFLTPPELLASYQTTPYDSLG